VDPYSEAICIIHCAPPRELLKGFEHDLTSTLLDIRLRLLSRKAC
jgi:hypothetical protein